VSKHTWVIYEGDGGHVGTYEVWKCSECGACDNRPMFGPDWATQTPDHPDYGKPSPFYPNGSGLGLTMDCDESKRLVAEAVRTGFRKDLRWDLAAVWAK
jgi:hypothetical protein